ncbi:glycosyltransferase, partial [Patescibacteria group bacterium]
MKVALVHDYLREYGGAERVLKVLSEIYPKADIYTAFVDKKSKTYKTFEGRKIYQSKIGSILNIWRLYSPLRFLIPWVWGTFNLSDYDLVVVSASWYITKGFKIGKNTKVYCYCHTPPRNLYGYQTSIKWYGITWNKFPLATMYANVVNHFLRLYDFKVAQKPNRKDKIIRAGVDYFIANSKEVASRIQKFYRRNSKVIYPPVNVSAIIEKTKDIKKKDYYLIVSRLVDSKGLEEAALAAKKLKVKLKIVGKGLGFTDVGRNLEKNAGENVELLGFVEDNKLWQLYAESKGFIALAKNEDFGMTVVEAQAAGTPVIAYKGGGFKESVIDGKTGVFVTGLDEKSIGAAIDKINKTKWDPKVLKDNARRFSKERFI